MELDRKNRSVRQQKRRVRPAFLHSGELHVQNLTHPNAARQPVKQAGMIPLEEVLHHQIVVAPIFQRIVSVPPSTGNPVPVINAASSEHRNNAAKAISSGCAMRPIGCDLESFSNISASRPG